MEHDNDNFQNALERIRREFGREIFQDDKRVFAILRDLAPGMEAESNVIRQLSKRGLLAELESLADSDDAPRRERVVMKLRACLTDYLQLSDERAEYYVSLLLNLYELPPVASPLTPTTAAGHTGPLTWSLNADGLLTISGGGPMEHYAFADDAVNSPWWERRAEIVSVNIRNGVTTVGDSAFYGCANLQSVKLPDSVTRIGEWAFADCAKLDAIALPDSVRRINRGAFSDCKALAEIDLPANLSVIESWTFCNCVRLRRVSIPDSVSSIGQRAFQGCTLLSHLQIPARTWADSSAFEPSANVTRRVPPAVETRDAAQNVKPRWKPIDIPAWLNGATYQKFLLFLFVLVVILRHGLLTLLLLLAPVGLFLFLERS